MKRLMLLLCLLMAVVLPIFMSGQVDAAVLPAGHSISFSAADFHEPTSSMGTLDAEENLCPSSDSFLLGSSPVQPFSPRQISSRPSRLSSGHFALRHLVKLRSHHLDNLVQKISQTYTTLKIPCRQRSIDIYVFAYRHIMI